MLLAASSALRGTLNITWKCDRLTCRSLLLLSCSFQFKKSGFSFFSFFLFFSLSLSFLVPNVFRNKYSNHVTRSDGHVKATAAHDHISLSLLFFPSLCPFMYTLTLQKKLLHDWIQRLASTDSKTSFYICHYSNLLLFGNGRETNVYLELHI